MLPPFHGERMRAYEEADRARSPTREIDALAAAASAFALHPRMRAITFEVILARGLRRHRRAARLARLRELLPRLLDGTASPALSFRVLLARRLGRPDPLERFAALARRDRRAAARRHRRAAARRRRAAARTSSRCCSPRASRTAAR